MRIWDCVLGSYIAVLIVMETNWTKKKKKKWKREKKSVSVFETALSVFTVSVIFSCSACDVTELQVGTLKISLPPLMTHAL